MNEVAQESLVQIRNKDIYVFLPIEGVLRRTPEISDLTKDWDIEHCREFSKRAFSLGKIPTPYSLKFDSLALSLFEAFLGKYSQISVIITDAWASVMTAEQWQTFFKDALNLVTTQISILNVETLEGNSVMDKAVAVREKQKQANPSADVIVLDKAALEGQTEDSSGVREVFVNATLGLHARSYGYLIGTQETKYNADITG